MVEALNRIELPSIEPLNRAVDAHRDKNQGQGASTLSKVEQVEHFVPSKPQLERPTPLWNALDQVLRLEGAANRYSLLKEQGINNEISHIQRLHLEESLKMQEALEAAKDVTFWGILEDMTTTVMSGVSFYFGFSALSAGAAAAGGVLITSGVLSLTNLAFKHGEIWGWAADIASCGNEDIRLGIETYVPPSIGVAAAVATMAGVYTAWSMPVETGMKSTLAILQTTTSLSAGMTALASGRARAHYQWTNADLSTLQTKAELSRIDLEKMIEETQDFHQSQTEIVRLVAKLIQEADQAVQVTQQPV